MSKPLIHRQKAARAHAALTRTAPWILPEERIARLAREMYPGELVKACADLLRIVMSEQKANERQWGMDLASGEIAEAGRALALYEETP